MDTSNNTNNSNPNASANNSRNNINDPDSGANPNSSNVPDPVSNRDSSPRSGTNCTSNSGIRSPSSASSNGSGNDNRAAARARAKAIKQQIQQVKRKLKRKKSGEIEPSLPNLLFILKHDPNIRVMAYNQFKDSIEVTYNPPWMRPSESKCWCDADDAQLLAYLHCNYAPFKMFLLKIAVLKVAADRSFHPIRKFIEELPDWDGIERVDRLFVDYLGAEDNEYVRAVIRKTLCAAIRRVLTPGCKFDYMPVLVGPQGISKSTLIAKLGGPWFSDSLSFNDTRDKTAAEKLQGYWILEIGELAGLKKADVETLRGFISRQTDSFRDAYGRRAVDHPRQCIFIATANDTTGFLRDITGNRRFWPINTPGGELKDPWDLTEAEIQQIWAEACVYVDRGEELYLDAALEECAKNAQRMAMENDDREGMVQEYLQTLLPSDWDSIPPDRRGAYLCNPNGAIQRTQVCTMEIWCECFNRRQEDIRASDSRDINAILTRLGWHKDGTKKRVPFYGPQYIFTP